jgi:hypothetical protein
MKLLFALASLALLSLSVPSHAAAKSRPKTKSDPTPAAAPVTEPAQPEAPRVRKPGFWERAWDSSKKGANRVWGATKKVGSVATAPFHRGDTKSSENEKGWRQLSMSMSLDPATVKLPETRSIRVSVKVVNNGKNATQLDFPTTQRIEVLLKNESGKVLAKWSEDQKVEAEEGFLVVNPQEHLEYTATISTREMTAGQTYLIEAYFPNYDQLRGSHTIVPTK